MHKVSCCYCSNLVLAAIYAAAVGGPAADGASPDGQSQIRDMVALDCEMCYCGDALEVTRITLLDSAGEVRNCTFIGTKLPKNATWFTDITSTALEVIQSSLTSLLPHHKTAAEHHGCRFSRC